MGARVEQRRPGLALLALCAVATGACRPQHKPDSPAPPPWPEVPAGILLLGSPPEEPGRDEDEGPQVRLALPAFRMMPTPVTAGAFAQRAPQVLALDPEARFFTEQQTPQEWPGRCNLGSPREDHPVNCVDFRAARAYCRLAGGDLPTEAEWEHAARAGASSPFFWGERFDEGRAVSSVGCGARGCRGGTEQVALEGPRCNALGLCDLIGNVWEWTRTGYRDRPGAYAQERPEEVPAQPVHRGGSWQNHLPFLFRSAQRGLNKPSHGLTGVGFRCVAR